MPVLRASHTKNRTPPHASDGWAAVRSQPPQVFSVVWHLASYGISRCMALRAVWHLAPFGISRRLASRAVWHLAPFGISRRLASRVVWHLARYPADRITK